MITELSKDRYINKKERKEMKGKLAEFDSIAFICPSCGVHSRQIWKHYYFNDSLVNVFTGLNPAYTTSGSLSNFTEDESASKIQTKDSLSIVLCSSCENHSVWMNGNMIFPDLSNAPLPTDNMPEDVLQDFIEARNVFNISPRASAALLRLSLQKLCVVLGGEGKNINKDIQFLVKNGLSERIQKALDIVRVIGNDSVHPGQIDINDNPKIAISLFEMINFIVDKMITEPQKIDDLYDVLPQDKRKGIEDRDTKAITI
jgi:hypothetical protein